MAHVNPTFAPEEPHRTENGFRYKPEHVRRYGEEDEAREERPAAPPPVSDMLYTIDQAPPWYTCIVLGLQHYLTMFGATFAIPLIVSPALCIGEDYVATSEILGTILFISGLVTIVQSTVGNRLPIIQGGSFAFLAPIFAILSLEKWQCPAVPANYTVNGTAASYYGSDEHKEVWTSRMREIQGAIIGSCLFEVVIGATGLVGLCLRFITPLSVAPTIALVGLALFEAAANFSASNWWISLMTMFFIIIFSQYFRNINIPICSCEKRCRRVNCSKRKPLFKMFPIILGVVLSWLTCAILTVSGALPDDPKKWGYSARTDTKINVLYEAKWFRFPYPGQWGMPTFSVAGVFGMLAGCIASMVESIGDYYACARLAQAPPPPYHAVNRGIFVEGIGCVLAGLWGTGSGSTSYSENIGAIGITKVASRRVVQVGGVIFIFFGVFAKFGALFVSIPDPIVGGVFMVMFGMIAAIGISNLQFVDMNSSRNLFIFGFSLFFGISMPFWLGKNPGAIQTGSTIADQILTVLLSTSMFVGGLVGGFLDNTVPGTPEERGINKWKAMVSGEDNQDKEAIKVYDLPLVMGFIRKVACFRYVPICPTFTGWSCRRRQEPEEDMAEAVVIGQPHHYGNATPEAMPPDARYRNNGNSRPPSFVTKL